MSLRICLLTQIRPKNDQAGHLVELLITAFVDLTGAFDDLRE